MERKKIDSIIKAYLEQDVKQVTMSPELQDEIGQRIHKSSKEEFKMKKISGRKIVLAAAVMCVLGSMAAIAAGKTVSMVTSINKDSPSFSTYEEAEKEVESHLGYEPKQTEAFANGYQFEKSYISNVDGMDEQGNVTGTYQNYWVEYQKGNERINLIISKPLEEVGFEAKETRQIGNVNIGYRADNYKFVPEDYQLTQEDQEKMDRKELMISYGSSEVEEEVVSYADWEQDGVKYSIMYMGANAMNSEAMFEMASELILK